MELFEFTFKNVSERFFSIRIKKIRKNLVPSEIQKKENLHIIYNMFLYRNIIIRTNKFSIYFFHIPFSIPGTPIISDNNSFLIE